MGIAITKLFADLLFWILGLLDGIMEMFRILCGIVSPNAEGAGDHDGIVDVFLKSGTITQAFMALFLISIFVCAVCVAVAIVKQTINFKSGGERKNPVRIAGHGFSSILVTMIMAVVMVLGIGMSNQILKQVDKATNHGDITISQRVFGLCVSENTVLDYCKPIKEYVYVIGEDGQPVPKMENGEMVKELELDENDNPVYDLDENGNKKPLIENGQQKVDEAGNLMWLYKYKIVYEIMLDENDQEMYNITYAPLRDGQSNIIFRPAWAIKYAAHDGIPDQYYSPADIRFTASNGAPRTTVDQVFGVRKKTLGIFENSSWEYKSPPMVELGDFNMFLAYVGAVVMLFALITMMLGLVKRIYDLVMLFLMLPLISATIPLDEGARFKTWRETVVSKVLLAYGSILAVNIFMLVAPLVMELEFGLSAFGTSVFKILMLIGGALSISGGQILLARVMGTSAEESRDMAQSARTLLGGAATAGGLVMGAKRGLFGGMNKYGRKRKGILGGAAHVGGFVANAVGSAVGGNAYRNKVQATRNKVKGFVGKVASFGHLPGHGKASDAEQSLGAGIPQGYDGVAPNDSAGNTSNQLTVLVGKKQIRHAKQDQSREAWRDRGLIGRAKLARQRHDRKKR